MSLKDRESNNLSLWWHSLGLNVGMYVLLSHTVFDFPIYTVIAIFLVSTSY